MAIRIEANAVTFANDAYSTLLAFAEDPPNPRRYVTLALTNSPDDRDVALGMEDVHIEAGDLKIDGYDLVAGLSLSGRSLTIKLEREAAAAAGMDDEIEIILDSGAIGEVPLAEAVRAFEKRIAARSRPRTG